MKYLGCGLLFIGGTILGWAATLYWLNPPTASADSAAWVQAVGSIAAIVGAFAVVLLQRHFQKTEDARKEANDRLKATRLADAAMNRAHALSEQLETETKYQRFARDMSANAGAVLDDLRSTIASLPIANLEPAQALVVVNVRHLVTKLMSICQKKRADGAAALEYETMPGEIKQVTIEIKGQLDAWSTGGKPIAVSAL